MSVFPPPNKGVIFLFNNKNQLMNMLCNDIVYFLFIYIKLSKSDDKHTSMWRKRTKYGTGTRFDHLKMRWDSL